MTPHPGRALIFDHRILHDAEPWRGGSSPRVIIRTDLIFERCAPQVENALPPLDLRTPEADLSPRAAAVAIPVHKPTALADVADDPFFAPLARAGGEELLVKAGHFQDGLTSADRRQLRNKLEWLATPWHAIARAVESAPPSEEPVVLVATGAFSPIHAGHIAMMEGARAELEKRGAVVLGGYLCPDHDSYVVPKCAGQAPTAAERVELCRRAVEESSWLMVDPWPALYAPTALNFTDLILRLERYVAKHVRSLRPIKFYFVCGGDNAALALAFTHRGQCVVVRRPGDESTIAELQQSPLVRGNRRVVVAEGSGQVAASSREIRAGSKVGIIASTLAPLTAWMERDSVTAPRVRHLCVRTEGVWALEHWSAKFDRETLGRAYRVFEQDLLAITGEVLGAGTAVHGMTVATQRAAAEKALGSAASISLDPCLTGSYNLEASRSFQLADSRRDQRLVARPGRSALELQIAAIPSGSYVLLEDDIATGKTIESLKRLLPERIKLEQVVAVNHCSGVLPEAVREADPSTVEVGDLRDFLLGARDGGLVVSTPAGALARAPYLAPYVSLADRMRFNPNDAIHFSRRVWELNLRLFSELLPGLRVSDLPPYSQALMRAAQFSPQVPLTEVCAWHLERVGG